MALKFRQITKVLFVSAAALYPVFVFYFLVIRKTPIQLVSLFVAIFALIIFLSQTSKKKV